MKVNTLNLQELQLLFQKNKVKVMKKASKILHICIPFLWIIVFFLTKYNLYYGSIYFFLWFFLPVIMFVFNTLSENKIKRLALLYIISTVMQVLGVLIYGFLYYNFIGSDPETHAVIMLSFFVTVILNIVFSLIGIIIKSIVYKFKKQFK